MPPTLIGRDGLELDAVVPQCLDNQFVSDRVFREMLDRGADYADPAIAAMREREFRTEFIRSVVYSSQVVVQRAYFKGSDFLYKNYLPTERRNFLAFAELVREKAIVPFLFREASLRDGLQFDSPDEGAAATNALLDELGDDVTCVRLSADDVENRELTAAMMSNFGGKISRLAFLDPEQRSAMASELFASPAQFQEEGTWRIFNRALTGLARYSLDKAEELQETANGRPLTRNDVYLDRFVRPDRSERAHRDNVVYGRFRRPGADDPFLLELKKYVDLVYNTNLPDCLNRYTFTPASLPTRMALQDDPRVGRSIQDFGKALSEARALEAFRRSFMARSQQAMSLPLLSDLTVADVREVRRLPEWTAFKDAQARILKEPLRTLELLEPFHHQFDAFQRALSDWYNSTYQRARTEERYTTFVSFALSVAGKLLVARTGIDGVREAVAGVGSDVAVAAIPKKVKGFAAKLMVGVYDVGKQKLDANRTYTVELMQTNAEVTREEVVELLQAFERTGGVGTPVATGQLADQGQD